MGPDPKDRWQDEAREVQIKRGKEVHMHTTSCINVEHLRKVYGSVTAIDDLSFEVATGEIFGMVGPNGAGKTTAVECLEGLRSPSDGQIRVLGLDPRKDKYALQPHIGVQLQQSVRYLHGCE